MNNQLPDSLAIRLERCLSAAGQDTSTLQAANPWDSAFNNPGGQHKRMIIEATDPQLAHDLKILVPGAIKQSLAMRAAVARGESPESFTGALAAEYAALNPQKIQEQASQAEQDQLAALEKAAADKRYQRELKMAGGNEFAAKQRIEQQDQAVADRKAKQEADRVAAAEMNKRIAERQAEAKRLAMIAQGNVVIS